MSVTFGIEAAGAESAPHIVTCMCGGAVPLHFPNRDAAEAWCDERNASTTPVVPLGCADDLCAAYSLHPDIADLELQQRVQLSNANARHILDQLGMGAPDMCGSASPDDLLGRVLIALAVAPEDAGVPATGNAMAIDCGRGPGYTQEKLEELQGLAECAVRRSALVVWC